MSDSQKPWLHGRKPGDRRVRVERPHSAVLPLLGPGHARRPRDGLAPAHGHGRLSSGSDTSSSGGRLSIHEEITERLSKMKALAIFSSDPISSSAYATEEILRVLVFAGAGALFLSLPIAIAVAVLLAVVSLSYRQIVRAYPSGGGDYAVARRNLPRTGVARRRRRAAPRLRHDGGGIDGLGRGAGDLGGTRPGPMAARHRVVAIVLITLGNMRGLRESGNIFAIPTYLFVGSALLMIAIGVFRDRGQRRERHTPPDPLPGAAGRHRNASASC